MTYEEAKLHKQELEKICESNSNKLNSFEKSKMGLTPDHIRNLPEWQETKKLFNNSFTELRSFNQIFLQTFKKEYASERRKY